MKITRRGFGRVATAGALGGVGLLAGALPCPAIAQRKVFKMKMGSPYPTTHPAGSRAVEVCDLIRQETKGVVDIEAFPNNQLGGESDMDSQLRSGAIDFLTTSGAVLQTVVPTSGINAVPFVFKNYDHVWSSMDGALGQYITEAVAKYGITMFTKATFDNGFRNITSSSKPINTIDDLKGFKIRVPVTPLWVDAFKALGAAPTTINLPELYSSLQTRIVDGEENPLVQINAFRLYEVQKYCAMTGHVWDGGLTIANTRKWEAVPKELQAIIIRNFEEIAIKQRADVFKMNNDLAAEMGQKGVAFNTPDTAPFREMLVKSGFYTTWKGKYGPEAWGALEKAVGTTLG
jgi:tripartite ATP-independent transporter DctP family solute receptor